MKSEKSIVAGLTLALLSTLNFQSSTAYAQGSLTPPGAPAPTMKTLEQIEPRTPISSLPYAITKSGSYYLTTNLTGVAGTNGITITAGDVTLDLNGFALIGVTGSSNGVFAVPGLKNLEVRHGVVRNWGGSGVDANVIGSQLLDLRLSDNGAAGARAGSQANVLRCVATGNTDVGLYGGNGSLIKSCTAGGNSGGGISAAFGGTVADCSAYGNTGAGITALSDSNVHGCLADDNTIGISTAGYCHIESCNASRNSQQGIYPNDQSMVLHCTADENTGDGIAIHAFSTVNGCTANANHGNGIDALSAENRIDGNNATYNAGQGIKLYAANTSIVIRNTAGANTGGNLPAAGSNIGPVQSPSSATSPTANFSF